MGQALGRTLACARLPNARVQKVVARLGGTVLLALTFLTAAAEAQTFASLTQTRPLTRTGKADPIRAWVDFCKRSPEECGVDLGERATIALTPEVWQSLVAVNRDANDRIKAVSDRDHWGVEDRWNLPDDGLGDCEDIQLLKRKILIERGLPRRAMRMTVVIDEDGEGHAVMMVRTDRGDLILDNRRMSVLPWTQTGYTYVKAEGQDGMDWVSLGGASSPIVTANSEDLPPVPPARVAAR
jgi:predicted transglutaminase-like cysteine proteinase